MNIILYLLQLIQYQHKQICWLLNFICRYIPLKQWAFDDSHSPKYQKFKIDKLPVIKTFIKQDWQFLLEYYQWKYGKPVKPVQRRNGKSFRKTPSALYVELHITTFTTIMAVTVNTSVKSVARPSAPMKSLQHLFALPALTAEIPSFPKKTVSSSAYINASIQNVLTISTILKRWLRKILLRIMAKININFITSTVNSLWISSPWT